MTVTWRIIDLTSVVTAGVADFTQCGVPRGLKPAARIVARLLRPSSSVTLLGIKMNKIVADTIRNLESFMATVDDAKAIPRAAGEFVHALIMARGVKRAVEIGTSYGYSGLWIASALAHNDGKLTTIDHDPRKSASARTNFNSAGLAEYVDIRTGTALDVLKLVEGPVDFVLSDADKENCVRYVEIVADRLSDRAIVLTDNTIDLAPQLAEFVRWIRRRDDFYSCEVAVGHGMELSIKRRSA